MYGPTTGDAVRLADTDLFAQIERDLTHRGDEAVFGGGKVIRDGMGHNGQRKRDEGIPDTVITNAIIIDHTGVYKADVAIRDGIISAIGAAGNPDIMDDVDIVIGASTEVIAGEHRILTAGGIDSHIHFISPTQVDTALASGVTTMIGGGTGPADGTNATTITPGAWNLARMLQAVEDFPMNIGLLGKGHASAREPLAEQLRAGAVGFKIHEDWGATHTVIDEALKVADEFDVQVAIHTDTLNECGFVEDTRRAVTPPTSSPWRRTPTSCRPRPTRRCPSRATPLRSISTCSWCATTSTPPSRRTSPSRTRASARRRSRPRTFCTTWACSR